MTDQSNRHILVVRFSALGDVAMTLPVIYSVARRWPSVRFTVVTRPLFARLFVNRPANVAVEPIDLKQYGGAGGMCRLLRRLAALRPTAVADLHNVLRTWVIDSYFRMRGVKVAMVDKKRAGRRKALRSQARQQSFIERYRDVFARLGLPAELTFRSVAVSDSPVEVRHPAVGIAPFARYATKTYPSEMMRRAVELLTIRGIHVYLFGGRGAEAEELARWADEAGDGCTSLAGRFPIGEELALLQRMDAVVSMDSANQHMASLTGAKVVTVWGATTPECGFAPYGQNARRSLVAGIDCQPCSVAGGPRCPRGHLECMRSLTPEAIVDKVIETIER